MADLRGKPTGFPINWSARVADAVVPAVVEARPGTTPRLTRLAPPAVADHAAWAYSRSGSDAATLVRAAADASTLAGLVPTEDAVVWAETS